MPGCACWSMCMRMHMCTDSDIPWQPCSYKSKCNGLSQMRIQHISFALHQHHRTAACTQAWQASWSAGHAIVSTLAHAEEFCPAQGQPCIRTHAPCAFITVCLRMTVTMQVQHSFWPVNSNSDICTAPCVNVQPMQG